MKCITVVLFEIHAAAIVCIDRFIAQIIVINETFGGFSTLLAIEYAEWPDYERVYIGLMKTKINSFKVVQL